MENATEGKDCMEARILRKSTYERPEMCYWNWRDACISKVDDRQKAVLLMVDDGPSWPKYGIYSIHTVYIRYTYGIQYVVLRILVIYGHILYDHPMSKSWRIWANQAGRRCRPNAVSCASQDLPHYTGTTVPSWYLVSICSIAPTLPFYYWQPK